MDKKIKLLLIGLILTIQGICQISNNGMFYKQEGGVTPFTGWESYSTIVTGLSTSSGRSNPSVVESTELGYALGLFGRNSGITNGYYWNGSTWTIAVGTADIGNTAHPSHLWWTDRFYAIIGEFDGVFNGYRYNVASTSLGVYATIVTGLSDIGGVSSPECFTLDGTIYMISGNGAGEWYGYYWSGTTWTSDTGILSGLPSLGGSNLIEVFEYGGEYFAITSDRSNDPATLAGWKWTGSTWSSNSYPTTGLTSVLDASPAVFSYDGVYYLILGKGDGTWIGYIQIL